METFYLLQTFDGQDWSDCITSHDVQILVRAMRKMKSTCRILMIEKTEVVKKENYNYMY